MILCSPASGEQLRNDHAALSTQESICRNCRTAFDPDLAHSEEEFFGDATGD